MTEFNIGEQRAENIYNADTIHVHAQRVDYLGLGLKSLAAHDYASARGHLSAAAEADPGNYTIYYYLSLAQLDGRRPHMHSGATVEEIQRRLANAADRMLAAKALLILVAEDYQLAWRSSGFIPDELISLVRSVPIEHALEIVEHVPAEQSRVWRLLAARIGGD
jgi:hypothetical protein